MVFYPRGRQPYSNAAPFRRDLPMYGPPRGRGYAPPPAAPMNRMGWQNPNLNARSYSQWNPNTVEQQRNFRQGQGDRINGLSGHMNTISNGLNMLSQLGSVLNSFRGF